jgi:hypothetical protein
MIVFNASQVAYARSMAATFRADATHRILGTLLDRINNAPSDGITPWGQRTISVASSKRYQRIESFVRLYGERVPMV